MASATRPKVGAFVSAVAAISCNGAQTATPSSTPVPSPTVAVGTAGPSAIPTADEPASPSDERTLGKQEARSARLRTRKEWREFKQLWQQLDAVTPPAKPGAELYAEAIDSSRAEALSKRMDALVRELETAKLLTPGEVSFFRFATSTRIQNMLHGSMPLMVMHRLPPPYARERYKSVNRLERRIDLLLDLKAKGRIEAKECQLALEHVQSEAVTLYVLHALQLGEGMRGATIEVADGDRMLAELDRRVAAARADAGPRDRLLAGVVAQAKTLVPSIRALIAELER